MRVVQVMMVVTVMMGGTHTERQVTAVRSHAPWCEGSHSRSSAAMAALWSVERWVVVLVERAGTLWAAVRSRCYWGGAVVMGVQVGGFLIKVRVGHGALLGKHELRMTCFARREWVFGIELWRGGL